MGKKARARKLEKMLDEVFLDLEGHWACACGGVNELEATGLTSWRLRCSACGMWQAVGVEVQAGRTVASTQMKGNF